MESEISILGKQIVGDEYRAKMTKYITAESGCNICPKCGSTNVVNQISFSKEIDGMGYEYDILCNDCKKSFKFFGNVSKVKMTAVSMISKSVAEYSHRLLIHMLSDARRQIEKSLHNNESRSVLITKNVSHLNNKTRRSKL